MPHHSFIKRNRHKLKELANSYNPGNSNSGRFVFQNNNSCDGTTEAVGKKESAKKSKNKENVPAQPAAGGKGRLFSFLTQSKFTN